MDDDAVLAAVARQVVAELLKGNANGRWILDDTGHAKKGTHSVGVARQYCGRADQRRCRKAGVPAQIKFRTKGEIARTEIEAALNAGNPRGVVLADAAYGDETDFRDWLTERQLDYVLGVRVATRLVRDARHQPLSVLEIARALPTQEWRTPHLA